MQETKVRSLGQEDSLEKKMEMHFKYSFFFFFFIIFLPGKSHGQRSLVVYSQRGCKDLETIQQLKQQQLKGLGWKVHAHPSEPAALLWKGLDTPRALGSSNFSARKLSSNEAITFDPQTIL